MFHLSAAVAPRYFRQSAAGASCRHMCSAAAGAGAGAKKGYWINHIVEIKDEKKFSAYLEASISTFAPGNKYGAKILMSGPVAKTLNGDENVKLAALVEFDSAQAAIDVWEDPDYVAARAEMGNTNDESSVVERRICVIESNPISEEIHPGDGLWLNHVEEILDEEKFARYVESSMAVFTSTHFGSVVHQHAGTKKIKIAAALRFESIEKAMDSYNNSPEYISAKFVGMMEDVEDHVVKRTICCVKAPEKRLRRRRTKRMGNNK